ncbi:ABC transporter ATP-binding protein [Variovorax sp. LjRoot175]|uniref:ABC transporter ATP-binding protein n=1 Tax=Variovorax sp. LjRoot175 TaxID=3342276 RepID=UPI003ED06C0D
MTLLVVKDVIAGYGASEQILKGASIDVGAGEIVTIIGPNGAGKSTLLKAVAGLVKAKEGCITLDGADVTAADALGRSKSGISFVPQERNVFGTLSVLENLMISAFSAPRLQKQRAEQAFERYPMLAEKRRAMARTLSGGQRQILAMAMGLMTDPKLILLDEPTAGLSPKTADELFEAIVALNQSGLPVLMVEQHAVEALAISTRGYVLVAGRAASEGTGPALAADPETRRLFLGG